MIPPRRLFTPDRRSLFWTAAVFVTAAPLVLVLSLVLWRTPFPLTEAVAIFEDAVRGWPPKGFPLPEQSYYRPLFYLTIGTLWHATSSLADALAAVKLVQIVPAVLLVVLFIWHVRPRSALDAAAATAAVAVIVGSPGFADNLELPLSYTIVGMPIALAVWVLLNHEPRLWRGAAVVGLTIVAIGFKEQGLVVVPLVLAAWWTGARGATRRLTLVVLAVAAVYVALRLRWRGSWAMFEQAVGFGFTELEPDEAAARFGAFPYVIYAYSAASTVANVLFAEPSRGVFRIVRACVEGRAELWQIVQITSSTALTAVIGWWGIRALRSSAREWTPDARVFVALVVVLAACGALSFNYSRARLGGMAVPFYALAAFLAIRVAAARALEARRWRFAVAAAALTLLAAAWHSRAVATLEHARATSLRNHREWLVLLPERRAEFADRPVYSAIMEAMVDQGTDPDAPRPTRFPSWFAVAQGEP